MTTIAAAIRRAYDARSDVPIPVEARALGDADAADIAAHSEEDFGNRVVATAARSSSVLRLGAPVVPTDTGAVAPLPVVNAPDEFAAASFSGTKRYAGTTKVSAELLDDAVAPIFASVVPRRLGESLGHALAADLLTGTGTDQPEGLLTGATAVTAAGATLAAADFESLFQAVAPHLRSAWLMSTSTYLAVKALGIVDPAPSGGPGFIYGVPVALDDDMPAVATGARPVALGDVPSAYLVRQVAGLTVRNVVTPDDFVADQVTISAHMRIDARTIDAAAVQVIAMP